MRKLLMMLCLLCSFCCECLAEIPCTCGLDQCICFIQLGDGGVAMEYIQHELIAQGYLLPSQDSALFDEHTLQAVLHFQEANGLPHTGLMDDATLTLLLWGMLPDALDIADPLSNGRAVWIPTDGGIRRHVKPTCSKMSDPRRVSVRNAAVLNMQPCGRCNKDGRKE